MKRAAVTTLLAVFLAPTIALAHTEQGDTSGLVHGFIHPLTGSDHVLVMVAVGLLSVQLGGRALWLVPLSFVGVMAIAGALGIAGIRVPACRGRNRNIYYRPRAGGRASAQIAGLGSDGTRRLLCGVPRLRPRSRGACRNIRASLRGGLRRCDAIATGSWHHPRTADRPGARDVGPPHGSSWRRRDGATRRRSPDGSPLNNAWCAHEQRRQCFPQSNAPCARTNSRLTCVVGDRCRCKTHRSDCRGDRGSRCCLGEPASSARRHFAFSTGQAGKIRSPLRLSIGRRRHRRCTACARSPDAVAARLCDLPTAAVARCIARHLLHGLEPSAGDASKRPRCEWRPCRFIVSTSRSR